MAKLLHDEFAPKHYKITTTRAPNIMLRFGGLFNKTIAMVNIRRSFLLRDKY